tara:strand:- start:905 stop:1051 length:147 start_codon:yes stop_codon:yes gene_type:complete
MAKYWADDEPIPIVIPRQKLQRSLWVFGACALATGIAIGNYLFMGSCV